jgi:hypothetical protein
MIISFRDTKAIVWSGVACATGVGCVVLAPIVHSLPFAAVGSLFAIGGGLLLWGAEDRIITLQRDGVCSVITKRLIGSGRLTQRFSATDIIKITYIKGITAGKRIQSGALVDEIYVVLSDGRKLNIMLQRFNVFRSTPTLASEAEQIAAYLRVPLEVIEATNVVSGAKNFDQIVGMGQHDPAEPILQQSAQDKLDSDDTMMSINNGRNNGK